MAHEFNGEAYKKSSTHQKEWGNKIISELSFRGDERVLDLGCGDGVLTAELAALAPRGLVLGIDSSRGMIEVASGLRQDNLEFRISDINNLDFEDEFDLIFSNATLHWVKDHERLLAACRRALKKNGLVRFNFAGDGNCASFFKVVRPAMKLPQFAAHFSRFSWPWYMPALDEYKKLAEGTSFSQIKVWGENADRYFPDKEAMIRWIDQPSLVPFLAVLPGDSRQAFRDCVVERMVEATLQPDGRCFETFRRINFSASK